MCDPLIYDEYSNDCYGIFSSMVTLRGRPYGSSGAEKGSGSDSGDGQLDD